MNRIIEVEIVLLRSLRVKRNVGRGTPTDDSLVLQINLTSVVLTGVFFFWTKHFTIIVKKTLSA